MYMLGYFFNNSVARKPWLPAPAVAPTAVMGSTECCSFLDFMLNSINTDMHVAYGTSFANSVSDNSGMCTPIETAEVSKTYKYAMIHKKDSKVVEVYGHTNLRDIKLDYYTYIVSIYAYMKLREDGAPELEEYLSNIHNTLKSIGYTGEIRELTKEEIENLVPFVRAALLSVPCAVEGFQMTPDAKLNDAKIMAIAISS